MRYRTRASIALIAVLAMLMTLMAPVASAHPEDGGGHDVLERESSSQALIEHDAEMSDIVSSGPSGKKIKNLDLVGRGDRLVANATTDVWAHDGYAYTGTFNSPCNTPEAGVWVWDVHNKNNPSFVGVIQSEPGDRTNDVRVASMNSGDILVMSNESCGGGDGGFEVWDVDDPENPVKLASVTISESDLNTISPLFFAPGALDNVGVHNLWLFTQGDKDYVAATSEGAFDNFRIYDITDPTSPSLVSGWGAEELVPGLPAGVDDYSDLTLVTDPGGLITGNALNDLFSGFGASANKFLHDVTISADGTRAYLANWDAGLVLLDISDPSDPQVVSVALDPVNGSLDGEVNSHSVWPSEDGTIVVEGEEDFSPFGTEFSITTGPDAGVYEAFELGFTTPINTLPGQEMSGPTKYVGLACNSSDSVPAGSGTDIALVLRGDCRFDEKASNVIAATGYAGMVVFTANPGDAPFPGGGNDRAIPGVMVGNATGLAIAGVASMADLVIGSAGESVSASTEPNAWSGLRIWDYSDPSNPILASLFDTVCSANPVDPSCDPAGTYSVHNVQVESRGNKTFAYVSWYSDGMLVLDVSDPYNPVEIARFFDNSQEFIDSNGGQPHDYWGVYKVENSPYIFASDRNGGLAIFKEKGIGSAKKGGNKKP